MNYENYRHRLFPFAYNILGSAEDAKDAIQDVLIKYHALDKEDIRNEEGFLIKLTVNHAINLKNRKSKMIADKVWLPEPVSTENMAFNIDREMILSYSLLVLLEKLTARERAVFVLKEAFDYSHQEMAETFGFSVENSRKLLSRAKSKLTDYKTERRFNKPVDNSFIEKYVYAMKEADIDALEKLLSEDILLAADGGEDIKVVRELTTGVRAASKLLLYVYKAFLNGLEFKVGQVNHQPAIFFYQNGGLYNCQVFEVEAGKIKGIYSIIDPSKLGQEV
ncbi:sigma-70 family RNA polymerase sigma factor [Fulvivirga ligni]|uniref:sigma-70 family RNA polymerase sigma factor n=1 Tax=Fulvivirga ligni TaxID=2904246 RepID=UPI001F27A654|nr:sigma-70 family RNA polymerase sigma factor [Fulvivirga ligni]UII20107.1 sigma-70 family RNA polymerase sigma factor [Fulvivirga ligni]